MGGQDQNNQTIYDEIIYDKLQKNDNAFFPGKRVRLQNCIQKSSTYSNRKWALDGDGIGTLHEENPEIRGQWKVKPENTKNGTAYILSWLIEADFQPMCTPGAGDYWRSQMKATEPTDVHV